MREDPPNKRCGFIASGLKDVFSHCHVTGRLSMSSPGDEDPATDFIDELEVIVSAIRTRAMEAKLRRKASHVTDSFWWVFSPTTGELFIASKAVKQREGIDAGTVNDKRDDEFVSIGSDFSRCSSNASMDEFLSVCSNFSRCSSLKGIEFQDFLKRSVIQELCHCEGWPFGLGRKALLLPPLPRSPSESWSWRKK